MRLLALRWLAAGRLLIAASIALAAWPLPVAQARPATAPPRGKADVYLSPDTISGAAAGTAFSVSVKVEPSSIPVDAASVALSFNSAYLEVDAASVASGAELPAVLRNTLDNAAGTFSFAAGKLSGPWPSSTFTLVSLTFRIKAAASSSLDVSLITGARNSTDVASGGASILNAARGGSIGFASSSSGGTSSSGGSGSSGSSSSSGSTGASGGSSGGGSVFVPFIPVFEPTAEPAPPPRAAAGTAVATVVATAAVAPVSTAAAGTTPIAGPGIGPPFALPRPPSVVGTTGGAPGLPPLASFAPGTVPPLPPTVQVAAAPVAESFQTFYAERQGLRVLGNTLATPKPVAGGVTAQYFEKGRMEEHTDEPNPAWRFQYGLLVDELIAAGAPLPVGGDASTLSYATLNQLTQPEGRTSPPEGFVGGAAPLPDGSVFIPFSAALTPGPGHVVPSTFWGYINNEALFPGGWLHDVGLPITEPVEAVVDKGPDTGRRILVQAFQRTILTFDPLNPADFTVERANVGTDYARAFPSVFS